MATFLYWSVNPLTYAIEINRTCRVPHADRKFGGVRTHRFYWVMSYDRSASLSSVTSNEPAQNRGGGKKLDPSPKAHTDKTSWQWFLLSAKVTILPTLPPLCLRLLVIMGKPLFLMLYGRPARLPVTATYDMLLDNTNKSSSVALPNVYAKALFGIFFTMAPPAHRPLPLMACFRQIPAVKVVLVLWSCKLKKMFPYIFIILYFLDSWSPSWRHLYGL